MKEIVSISRWASSWVNYQIALVGKIPEANIGGGE
jgi:hypothetical protein